MKNLTLFLFILFLCSTQSNAQLVLTDSMNLGEDRSSHNYQEYGSSISMGNYDCSGDSAITVGANNQDDSIVFELSVTPNTDEIRINWNFAWFNSGNNGDEFTRIVIENDFEEAMESPGPNAIGSHPVSCSLDSHELVFTALSDYTADGVVKVKIYDPYPSFNGNASISKIIIYSKTPPEDNTGIGSSILADDLNLFPNPFRGQFLIQSGDTDLSSVQLQLFDVLGKRCEVDVQSSTTNELRINAKNLSKGIYHITLVDLNNGSVIFTQKLIKN